MKNLSYLIVMLLVALFSCTNNTPKPTQTDTLPQSLMDSPEEAPSLFWKSLDFFYVKDGGLYFYSIYDGDGLRFIDELDSILNAIYAKNGIIYYNVAVNDRLLLRCLDLNQPTPMPEQLADWDVPLSEESEYNTFGDMYLNYEETQIALERDVKWFAGVFYNLAVYDIASKTITVHELYKAVMDGDEFVTLEDLPDNSGFNRWDHASISSQTTDNLLENVDNEIYYVGNGQRVCLTDQIDIDAIFGFGLGKEEYDVDASMDPTGKRVLIGYSIGMGDGTLGSYFVSSIDGKKQLMLPGSDYESSDPTWLSDGSLLYVGYDDESGLYLLYPDGIIHLIDETEIYAVLH